MKLRRILQPNKRSAINVGILLVVFLLLLLSVSGVFYIRFSLSWDSSLTSSGANDALVSFGFRPENFIGAKGGLIGQSSSFWWSQLVCFLLALILPYCRPIRASVSALLASVALVTINLNVTFGGGLTLEFGLMTIFILFAVYILLSFYGELVDKKQLTRVFSQYVPPEIAQDYSKNPEKINLEGEAREITVMFCDIKGFTSISEKLDPRELAIWLNRYFNLASEIIVRHKGTIDKYMGDSVMAFWGAPVRNDNHAGDALAAALEIQRELASFRIELQNENLPDLYVGIGISSGISNVGNMGSEFRMAYTVVGDTVNIAERLERQTRYYDVPIIVSDLTSRLMPDVLFRELDIVKVKGRSRYVKIYQPMYRKDLASSGELTELAMHRQALDYFRAREWRKAESIFNTLNKTEKSQIYEIYLSRLQQVKAEPPDESWKGETFRTMH
ncbi:MAG: adenylate/guanylate cyclase domain-containing protein [Pseudomonadota bacterium]